VPTFCLCDLIFSLFKVMGTPSMSGKLDQLNSLLEPAVIALGYQLWGTEFRASRGRSMLRVYIDSPNGITVDDCAAVSHQVSGILDVEDPISGEYVLEVSSPGMDRPLFTAEQYLQYIGWIVEVRLRYPFEGRKRFKGILSGIEDQDVMVVVDAHEFLLPIEQIDRAHLVPQFEGSKPVNPSAKANSNDDEEDNEDEDDEHLH
jgi:ribosome maturation factor RimP